MIFASFHRSVCWSFSPAAGVLRPLSSSRSIGSIATFSRILPWNKRAPATNSALPESLPIEIPIEEEKIPGYYPKNFYHPNPGQIVNARYELKAKLGYGTKSTVWLAQDTRWRLWSSKPYVAIKFNNTGAKRELEISEHIVSCTKSGDSGSEFIRTASDSFEISGPNGSHICLVLEPMRDTISLLRRRLCGRKLSKDCLPLFKCYIGMLLNGLDFLHTKCQVVHTDLKLDNILLSFEDNSVIEEFVQGQVAHPMPRKVFDDRIVYLCHDDFGHLRDIDGILGLSKMVPKITDFSAARRADSKDPPQLLPIQPDYYRAPEVLFGTGWSCSADMWNFGAMIWELLAGETLFKNIKDEDGTYNARRHLADMIALLGPVPLEVIQREKEMRKWRWSPGIRFSSTGKLCDNVADLFDGPFFDDDGKFVGSALVPSERSLKGNLPECIADEDAELFISFMKSMLCWNPGERATAKDLQKHPWLDVSQTHAEEG